MGNNTERVPSPDDPVLDINESSRCPFTGGAIKVHYQYPPIKPRLVA